MSRQAWGGEPCLEACRQAGKGAFWLAYQRAQVVGLRGYDKQAIRVLGEHEFRRHAADDGFMCANDRHRGQFIEKRPALNDKGKQQHGHCHTKHSWRCGRPSVKFPPLFPVITPSTLSVQCSSDT